MSKKYYYLWGDYLLYARKKKIHGGHKNSSNALRRILFSLGDIYEVKCYAGIVNEMTQEPALWGVP